VCQLNGVIDQFTGSQIKGTMGIPLHACMMTDIAAAGFLTLCGAMASRCPLSMASSSDLMVSAFDTLSFDGMQDTEISRRQ
jgi:hypothetical protein